MYVIILQYSEPQKCGNKYLSFKVLQLYHKKNYCFFFVYSIRQNSKVCK